MALCKTFRNGAQGKFYYGVKGTSLADADEKSKALGEKVLEMIHQML